MAVLQGYVYILTNKSNNVLYIGVCKNLESRLITHRLKINRKSFSARYNLNKLLFYERYERLVDAIAREKQLKRWKREWKYNLIKSVNPEMKDLAEDFIQ